MQNQFSLNYDSNKMLMQTFGRGNMPKFVEPKLSQRNAFQQEKFLRQKYAKRRQNQSKNKQKMINMQKASLYDEQHSQPNQQRNLGNIRTKGHYDDIDNINNKINGLIKSIQMSCNKKEFLGSKSNKIQKCETNQKIQKKEIDFKRDKLLESAIARKTFVSGFDSFGTKQEPNRFKQQKRENKTLHYESKYEKNTIQSNQNYKKQEKKMIGKDEQDQIQERIRKIQDKISIYQLKMGSLQPNNHKLELIERTVEKPTLKQIKDYTNYSNAKHQMGSRLLQKNKQQLIKEEKTAKKETFSGFQRQSNKKSHKKNNLVANTHQQKQNRKQEKMFESLQIKSRNFQAGKSKDLQANQKNDLEKEVFHSKGLLQIKQKVHNNHQKLKKAQLTPLQSSKALKMHQKLTFIKVILQQIQYDQDFRHTKHMFGGIQGLFDQNYQTDKKKWVKLKDQLKKQGFCLSINEVKQIFMPRDDQIDPFMSVSHSHDELIHGVIFAYQAAQKHWNDHIYRNWTLWQLKQSNFTSQTLDRGKKGYVSLQDLTFYINTEIDGNYRNRDLLLIFNRLGQNSVKKVEHGLSFKVIMDRLLSL